MGLILAGGLGRRMGVDEKSLMRLDGKPLLQWVIERAEPQVDELLLNANGDPKRFADFGLDILPDSVPGHLGPLAGILTGLEWMKEHRPDAEWLATFACDTPFFPGDLIERLIDRAEVFGARVALAESGERQHHIFGVWSASIKATAASVLQRESLRKMEDFISHLSHTTVEYPTEPLDPFFNVNTLNDLSRAEAIMAARNTNR